MNNNRYLLVATPEELNLEEAQVWKYDRTIIVTGPGPTNVIRACRNIPRDSDVLNVGYVGSPNLSPGTKVDIWRAVLWLPKAGIVDEYDMDLSPIATGVKCYTVGDFCTSSQGIDPGSVVDMELAYIAAFGFDRLNAVKYVSDNLNKEQYDLCLRK